jgi:hypothetical protein
MPASGTLETIFMVSASRRLRPLKRVPPGRIGTVALPLRKTQPQKGEDRSDAAKAERDACVKRRTVGHRRPE